MTGYLATAVRRAMAAAGRRHLAGATLYTNVEPPELVVWGKYDRFISSKLGDEIAEKLPNARLEVIDKSGHYVHMDKPQELVQVVTKFLDEAA